MRDFGDFLDGDKPLASVPAAQSPDQEEPSTGRGVTWQPASIDDFLDGKTDAKTFLTTKPPEGDNIVDEETGVTYSLNPKPAFKEEDSYAELARKLFLNTQSTTQQIVGGGISRYATPENMAFDIAAQHGMDPNDFGLQQATQGWRDIYDKAQTNPAKFGQDIYDAAQKDIEAHAPKVNEISDKRVVYDLANVMVQMVPTIVAAVALKRPDLAIEGEASQIAGEKAVAAGSLGVMAGQVGGQQYGQARSQGLDPQQAEGEAALYELAETLTEVPFLENFIKEGKGFMSGTLKAMGFEAFGESVNQAVEQAYEADKQARKEGISFSEAWDKQGGWGAVGYAGLLGGLAGGIFHGAAHVMDHGEEEQSTLTPEDHQSPVPDADIDEGKKIIAQALGDYDHNKVLEDIGLPGIGSRVTVDYGDGRTAGGKILGAFQTSSPQLGLTGRGPTIQLDDGTKLEETIETLQRAGVSITPEVAQQIISGEINAPPQGTQPSGVQPERPGNGQQLQSDGQAGEQPPAVVGQGAEAGGGGGVPAAGTEPAAPGPGAAPQEVAPPEPAPVEEPPAEQEPIGEPPQSLAGEKEVHLNGLPMFFVSPGIDSKGAKQGPFVAHARTPDNATSLTAWGPTAADAEFNAQRMMANHLLNSQKASPKPAPPAAEAGAKAPAGEASSRPPESAAKPKAPVDEWAADIAQVYREQGEAAALARRDELVKLHKINRMTYAVLSDKLRALLPEAVKGPGVEVVHVAPKPKVETQAAPSEASKEFAPHLEAATAVHGRLEHNPEPLTAKELMEINAKAHGGTIAEGKFTPKDAYDSMELGVNHYIRAHTDEFSPRADIGEARKAVAKLNELASRLPTQTRRTEEMETHQQFSTPPDYSYVANWVANIKPGEKVLEPSAGTGNLAVHALNAGAKVTTNEIAPRRAAMVSELNHQGTTYREDAAHLNAILPKTEKPTVVIMNPPFSQTAGRLGNKRDTDVGASHIEQALKRLEPGGRLVAITGRGMAFGKPAFASWWNRIGKEYNVRANISVSGDVYKKFGTTFGTQLLVIDKSGPTGEPITGEAATTRELLDLLEKVRDERVPAAEHGPVEPGREDEAGGGEGRPDAAAPVSAPTDELGPGRQPGGDRPEPSGQPGSRSGGDVEQAAGPGDGVVSVPGGQTAPERPAGTPAKPGPGGSGKGAPGRTERPALGGKPVEPAKVSGEPGRLELETIDGKDTGELTDEVYESYRPSRVRVAGAKPHPTELVESAAMASVLPPAVDYKPSLPAKIVKDGLLSEAQLEAVIYAGHAHQDTLPDGTRRGYFIGDGTGVGKGRELSGIIRDNWEQGRKRHVWLSKNKKLLDDAKRDWVALGGSEDDFVDLGKVKLGTDLTHKQGIVFATYDTLKTGSDAKAKQKAAAGGTAVKSRLEQLAAWAGPDFDGVLAFDEAHLMGNAVAIKGKRGMMKPSARALAGVEVQKRLPQARVVYASATGATDIVNLAYAHRLGLWGTGTSFVDVNNFINEISQGGVAAMELVARDLKALGLYGARSLSFRGVEQARLTHQVTPEQRTMYDELARGWQLVLQNVDKAMEEAGSKKNSQARSSALSAFWSSHQRFFNSVLTGLQMPSVLEQMEKDLKDGYSVVGQLVNTNEAAQERAAAAQDVEEGEDLTSLDMSPMSMLMQYIEKSFPTAQYEDYVDDEGNIRSRPVVDSSGNLVTNPEAEAMRDALLTKLGSLKAPEPPLEQIIKHFGTDMVSEVTGRQRRFVRQPDGTLKEERRGDRANKADISDFQNGKKRVLVFSDAGGTGASYHADRTAKNQQRRMHYLLQAGWRADSAIQGLGRSHRSNQAVAPLFRLVETSLKGHKRFISTIARRLNQLGALTKGERQAGGQGLFSEADNLESSHADEAVRMLFRDIFRRDVPGIDMATVEREMGIKLVDEKTGAFMDNKIPSVPQFLNRLLSLTITTQDKVFDAFMTRFEAGLEAARESGRLDVGTETVKADSIKKTGEKLVYKDPRSGAETRYVRFDEQHKIAYVPFSKVAKRKDVTFLKNIRSGRIWAVATRFNDTDAKGNVIPTVILWSPNPFSRRTVRAADVTDTRKWTDTGGEAKALWEKEIADGPKFETVQRHLITGAILPVWNRLKGNPRIFRLQTDDGQKYLGRFIDPAYVNDVLTRLGLSADKPGYSPQEAVAAVVDRSERLKLANGWTLKRSRVGNEVRIELEGPSYDNHDALRKEGVAIERIGYTTRYFLPTGEDAARVMGNVTQYREIVETHTSGRAGAAHAEEAESRPEPTSAPAAKAPSLEDLRSELAEETKRLAIGDKAMVHVVDSLQGLNGVQVGRLIAIAQDAKQGGVFTLNHEAVHLFRGLNLFRPLEWLALMREVRGNADIMSSVKRRYPELDHVSQLEEGVADLYARYHAQQASQPGVVRALFNRVTAFLKNVVAKVAGRYSNVPDLLQAIDKGYIGRRGLAAPKNADGSWDLTKPPTPKLASESRAPTPYDAQFPRIDGELEGREVLDHVPNTSSIGASFNDYTVLPGIRSVPMSHFGGPRTFFYAADDFDRADKLSEQIAQSGKIKPLIVAVDSEGPYVLEGAHRAVALQKLGVKAVPAMVVIDEDNPPVPAAIDEGGPMGLSPSLSSADALNYALGRAKQSRGEDGFLDRFFRGKKPETPAEGPTEKNVGIKADLEGLMSVLGSKLYKADMPRVTVKELLQNSWDGIKSALNSGTLKPGEGHIGIAIDKDARTITFDDNGSGMSPKTVEDALLTIAGTFKEGLKPGQSSGGFGIAKMGTILAADHILLETVHNGVKTTLDADRAALLRGEAKLRSEKTDAPNGTKIELKVPETAPNPSTGEPEPMHLPDEHYSYPILDAPLIGDVGVDFTRRTRMLAGEVSDKTRTLDLGRKQNLKGMDKITTAHFPWGDVDIYRSNKDFSGWKNHEVLSSGIHQFDTSVSEQPLGHSKIPERYIFDVQPSVEAHSPNYPFNNQREGWAKAAEPDVAAMNQYLRVLYGTRKANETKMGFADVSRMPLVEQQSADQVRGSKKDYAFTDANLRQYLPKPPDQMEPSRDIYIQQGKRTGHDGLPAVDDGTHKMPELGELQIPADKLDTLNPFFHTALNVDLVKRAAEISNVPEQGLRYFIARLGTVVNDFAAGLAKLPAYKAFAEEKRAVGVSFSKRYQGANVMVPFRGFFINPFGQFVEKSKTSSGIAETLMHTMVHEAVHENVRPHNEQFSSGELALYAAYDEHNGDGAISDLRQQLTALIREHRDAYDALNRAFLEPATDDVAGASAGIQNAALEGRAEGDTGLPSDEDEPVRAPGRGSGSESDVAPAQRRGLAPRANRGLKRSVAEERFEPANPEVRERFDNARLGVKTPGTMRAQLTAWFTHLANGFTRHYIDLPVTPEYADVAQQLRKLEAAPEYSKERIVQVLRSLVGKMSPNDYELFTWKVILDDLKWTAEQGMEIPFGYKDAAEVRTDLASVDRILADNPRVLDKVRERKLIVSSLADELVEHGILRKEQIKNPAYYRHVVLDYARSTEAYARGTGEKLRTPYWAQRKGSQLDINANLLEAEFDWMHKAYMDIAAAKTIGWIKDSTHNVRDRVIAAARAHNNRLVGAKLKADLEANGYQRGATMTSPLNEDWIDFKRRIAIGFKDIRDAIENTDLMQRLPAEFRGAAEQLAAGEGDEEGPVFPFLAHLMENDLPGAMGAATAFKSMNARKEWTRRLLGRQYADTKDMDGLIKMGLAPEGYTSWQPNVASKRSGKAFTLFTSRAVSEHVIDRIIPQLTADMPMDAPRLQEIAAALRAGVREVLSVGGPQYQMVLPEDLAETLNNLQHPYVEGMFDHLAAVPTGYWKIWTLINPRRWAKYNINNLSGDLDAVIAGNPRLLKRVPEAFRELRAVMFQNGAPSARYNEALERGVFGSGLTIQEVPDVNTLDQFAHVLDRVSALENPGKFAHKAVLKVWNALKQSTQFRENVLRYAAYLDYAKRIEGGEPMEKIGYGAASQEMVDAVEDPKDRAALLARELLGDYGNVSYFGQQIRRKLIPFYSWLEINTRRYVRLIGNAWDHGAGRGLATGGYLGATLGMRSTAWAYTRMALMYAAVVLWNRMLFGDEEDKLDETERVRLHINLGEWGGQVRLLRFQGALSDFMGWLGFEDAQAVISEILKGRMTWGDLAETLAKAPVQKIATGLTPVLTVPIETLTGFKWWPDVFDPRVIRDKWRNAFATFSLEHEYDMLAGKPSRGYAQSFPDALVTSRDPGEEAYNQIRGLTYDYLHRVKGQEGKSSMVTPRSTALYEWKLAQRYGDKAAEAKAFQKMRSLGMTPEERFASIRTMSPLGALSILDRGKFKRTLTSREQAALDEAQAWYKATFNPSAGRE
jgi:tRNA G10  N-methylase Trm11